MQAAFIGNGAIANMQARAIRDIPGSERVAATPLGEVRYAGWMGVEMFDYAAGSERVARESLAFMRRIEADLG